MLLVVAATPDCACEDPDVVSASVAVLAPDRTSVDAGGVFPGASADVLLRLTNYGQRAAQVSSVRIDGDGAFSLLDAPPSSVAPQDSVDVRVRFAPPSIGSFAATLVVVSDAEPAQVEVALLGQGLSPLACDDGNPCTDDAFDVVLAACVHTAAAGPCDDGSACTDDDVCVDGACLGEAIVCDDEDPCTLDTCESVNGCVYLPDQSVCDDGNPCTDDVCLNNGACAWVDKPDNTVCTDVFTCESIALCQQGTCTDFPVPDGAPCSDGDVCTVLDTCQAGTCVGTAAEVPPSTTYAEPTALPRDYVALATLLTDTHLVQVAPGFLSVFDAVDPSALTYTGSIPLPGAFRAESLARFDDGRVVAVLPDEGRVLVVDPGDETGPALVADVALPDVVVTLGAPSGAISVGDRVYFIAAGFLRSIASDLSLSQHVLLEEGADLLVGSPTRAFLTSRNPTTANAASIVYDLTTPEPTELATLAYGCVDVADDDIRVACRTFRDVDGLFEPRIAVFEAASVSAGEPTLLAELPYDGFNLPRNKLALFDGFLLMVETLTKSLVFVDPLTMQVLMQYPITGFPIRGSTVRVLDDDTLVSDRGQWIELTPTGAPGGFISEIPRSDVGAIGDVTIAPIVDGESAWLVAEGGVARTVVDVDLLTTTHVAAVPTEPADAYRGFALMRLPTSTGPRVAHIAIGGALVGAQVPVDVAFGPTGLTTTRGIPVAAGRPFLLGGALALDAVFPPDAAWRVFDTSSAFLGSGVYTQIASIPNAPILDDTQGIPSVSVSFSSDGRRALITQTESLGEERARLAVVDLTNPSAPTIGGVPVAEGAAYTAGTLDDEGDPGEWPLHVDGFIEQDHVFLSWTSTGSASEYFAFVVDASDPMAPVIVGRGVVVVPSLGNVPSTVLPLVATQNGRVFFGGGPYAPAPGYVASVDLSDAAPGSITAPDDADLVEVPSIPTSARLVGGALFTVGVGWMASISPPCDP